MSSEKRKIAISLPSTGDDEWQAVREPLMSGWLTQGPKVAAFEKAFAQRHQVKYAFAVTSCTTGLHLALAGLDIGPGDEVIVPAFTWVASANAVLYCGATPVFVDVERETFNLNVKQVAGKITNRTKAIIAVHLFGRCADIDSLSGVLPENVAIVEDAACAAGSDWKGRPAGSLGKVAAFSFHPRKSVTTGEGGMVTTNDSELAERMDRMRNHGAGISEEQRHSGPKPYLLPDFDLIGYNYRMTDMQGAVGLVQLRKLDMFIDERANWARFYRAQLADLEWLRLPGLPEGSRHGWQAFVTYVDPQRAPLARNAIMEYLQAKGISTRPGTHAVHMLGFYRERFTLKPEDFPAARDCNDNSMAIPLHNRMTPDDYGYVIEALRSIK
jgi:dTDP-4-amino-4,6-dideoxygalactose transaminase